MLRWFRLRLGLARLPDIAEHAVVTDWSDGRVTVTEEETLDAAIARMNAEFRQGAVETHVWSRPPRPWSWKRG